MQLKCRFVQFVRLAGCLRARTVPPEVRERAHSFTVHRDTFSHEQGTLQVFAAAVAANVPSCCNNAVTRHIGTGAVAHDVAHCTACPRTPGELADLAVGADMPGRYSPNQRQYAPGECVSRLARGSRSWTQRKASFKERPAAVGRGILATNASVGATSAGDAEDS